MQQFRKEREGKYYKVLRRRESRTTHVTGVPDQPEQHPRVKRRQSSYREPHPWFIHCIKEAALNNGSTVSDKGTHRKRVNKKEKKRGSSKDNKNQAMTSTSRRPYLIGNSGVENSRRPTNRELSIVLELHNTSDPGATIGDIG